LVERKLELKLFLLELKEKLILFLVLGMMVVYSMIVFVLVLVDIHLFGLMVQDLFVVAVVKNKKKGLFVVEKFDQVSEVFQEHSIPFLEVMFETELLAEQE
jgi:hypothetical protein